LRLRQNSIELPVLGYSGVPTFSTSFASVQNEENGDPTQKNALDKRATVLLNRQMQTLGLSSQPQPADGLLKRLFWPSIESQYDVDLLGQQGFWICSIVALLSLVLLAFLHMPGTGFFTAVVFFLGGCGVRQRSLAAASLVFAMYLVNLIAEFALGSRGNPFVSSVILMILFANIRATVLSRRWIAQAVNPIEHEFPERSIETTKDKFANVLPAWLWPKTRYAFFPLAALLLLLTIAGTVMLKKQASARTVSPETNSTLEVAPPN
jgi:hypothetical protein